MSGFSPTVSDDGSKTSGGLRVAHPDSTALLGEPRPHGAEADGTVGLTRVAREHLESETLAPGAANALGAGSRRMPEAPDDWRTCFERDRDRILHSPAFRRLAGKTQVFIFPDDHVRTRLTHALEVAQVATSVARACRLNVALTEAIALGHDCGHGPGGHASEDALSPYIEEGFDHAPWGAKVSLAPLNLCDQTLDGIANHSWSRPAPSTCEGEVVSWADRIAYVCHDWEDAVRSGVVAQGSLDPIVERLCGRRRSRQLGTFISRLVSTSLDSGRIAMDEQTADALARFREHNYRHIYLRPASRSQAAAVVKMLRALVEHFASSPNDIPGVRASGGLSPADPEALREAVDYVAGMTDRFACRSAASLLGWDEGRLPIGLGP
ncbi:MAG: HD domain-containing protein [Acidimicrobiales bacterium]